MAQDDSVDFDVIEGQKENIQSLPGGRSAKKLVEIYSPSPLHKLATPTPSDTRNVNDCIRAEYEAELQNINESDDPLDVFDRYVRWTLDAYPSAQATPQSQLHSLLERATKTFIGSAQYKNDPRYLKLWLHYIHFFSDSPREAFVFLSRHAIGENLALFYEEYAEWLEGVGRWAQAEEVYKMGIEREARPVQRLLRKFKEFEERLAHQPDSVNEPTSPALPSVRPALAAKSNPFTAAAASSDPQTRRPTNGGHSKSTTKPKMAIFSDADSKPPALSTKDTESKGWDTIGSMAERKKENEVEKKPWVGETLKAGGKKATAAKMSVFRDPTGKRERIYVDLATVYPTPEEQGTELSFEEVIAARRGWLDHIWDDELPQEDTLDSEPASPTPVRGIVKDFGRKLVIHRDPAGAVDENGAPMEPPRPARGTKKKKQMEYNETQIIKAKLDSPSGPKLKKKNVSEPTMTLHTRAATDDIYDIFNAPLKSSGQSEASENEEDYDSEGDYSTDAESTCTTRQVDATERVDEDEDARSVSEWSDFTARKHIPNIGADADSLPDENRHYTQMSELGNLGENDYSSSRDDLPRADEEHPDTSDDDNPRTWSSFVPVPPEDYDPPTRPYRDPAEIANNRLPFMTPITERTEVSLEVMVERRDQFKTPCKKDSAAISVNNDEEASDLEPMSSPIRELISPPSTTPAGRPLVPKAAIALSRSVPHKSAMGRGPIIKDAQCNPIDESVRNEILAKTQPPLSAYSGFYDHREEKSERSGDIRRYTKALQKQARGDKAMSPQAPVNIGFPAGQVYSIKRELGAGAFAPVYLVENSAPNEIENDEKAVVAMGTGAFAVSHRHTVEALKMENPPTPWEFHMMRVAHIRLGPHHRATASLSYAHEMHLYRDEAFLFLPFHPHGTLLDVVNIFRAEASGVMDEQLAMFFSIELLRTAEALHAKGIMHGDIKPDNCLLRLDNLLGDHQPERQHAQHGPLSSQWQADGSGGWGARGVTLIDFGRAIDMRAFAPNVQFIADWKTTQQDCAETREGRPWTWQLDYHGLAGTIHCLLFGKYIETVRCDQGGISIGGRKYRIRESLKRYWQTELWGDCFDVLLNPGSHLENEDGSKMPILRSMRDVRERMERWLEDNSERGTGLKVLMMKLEAHAKARRH
ncbi:Checkpoint serine/threonine-protein kinase-like protein [Emericellopsis cladophorae]|uniref:Checkpoint serine/threonine-protein kinase-like protein n=1 Tax=Emericellopsis cladophorae TaxID=2686198 RepID=A0A9P9XWG8_9HYPO|nr:Checkpoint serine/threonine-protein kinase-like protein [Emericellopsis cladophorae]KAI6779126.1 Checkpoint serine/threonine-protein kinase-like protein [Emericellopsis cladophorae]